MSAIDSGGGNTPFTLAGASTITTANNLVTLSGAAPVTSRTLLVNGVEWLVTWTSSPNGNYYACSSPRRSAASS